MSHCKLWAFTDLLAKISTNVYRGMPKGIVMSTCEIDQRSQPVVLYHAAQSLTAGLSSQ